MQTSQRKTHGLKVMVSEQCGPSGTCCVFALLISLQERGSVERRSFAAGCLLVPCRLRTDQQPPCRRASVSFAFCLSPRPSLPAAAVEDREGHLLPRVALGYPLFSGGLRTVRRGALVGTIVPACHVKLQQTRARAVLQRDQVELWRAYALARSVGPGQMLRASPPREQRPDSATEVERSSSPVALQSGTRRLMAFGEAGAEAKLEPRQQGSELGQRLRSLASRDAPPPLHLLALELERVISLYLSSASKAAGDALPLALPALRRARAKRPACYEAEREAAEPMLEWSRLLPR